MSAQEIELARADESLSIVAHVMDVPSRLLSEARFPVILSGAGDVFCAGGDLGWMQDQMAADRATRMVEATGPKTSSRARVMPSVTSAKTVGCTK